MIHCWALDSLESQPPGKRAAHLLGPALSHTEETSAIAYVEARTPRCRGRNGLRYPSDLSDAEWAIVEPMIPPARHGGRKRSVNVREVLNGIFYVLWTGCQWKALPKDLPPKSTVHDYLDLWNWDGTLERIHHALYVAVREQAGREASPTVAIIDSQTAKGAQKGGLGSILRAMTRARRSRVASGTSWSTRWASC